MRGETQLKEQVAGDAVTLSLEQQGEAPPALWWLTRSFRQAMA